MQKNNIGVILVAAVALAVLGAAPVEEASTNVSPEVSGVQQQTGPSLLVHNHNSLDVEVVAMSEPGRRFRLGVVNRGGGRTFALPEGLSEGGAPFRVKVYSIARKIGPSVFDHYLQAVMTQPLSAAGAGPIVLHVKCPLTDSFVESGTVGGP